MTRSAERRASTAALLRLQSFPEKDTPAIHRLRRQVGAAPDATDKQMALALAREGCTYEAAFLLRPLRPHWRHLTCAPLADGVLAAQAWWNKNWRPFARLRSSGQNAAALALLGDSASHYWDLPPLLVHLGDHAAQDDHPDLARHLYQRVHYLAVRGLPKMSLEPFLYVSQAALADLLAQSGNAVAALKRHKAIVPNPGNAMAHELQEARLLVAVGKLDEAMRCVAAILVTAHKHRTGYSRQMRLAFVKSAPELAPLRKRADWAQLLHDPGAYQRGASA